MPSALIADDEPMMRAALRDQLQQLWPELEIVAEAEDGPEALRRIESLQPDFAFLDIRMPGLSGLAVAQALNAPTRVVFVTAYDNHALDAFEANAVDYVLKPLELARIAKLVAKLQRQLQGPAQRTNAAWMGALNQRMAGPEPERLEWLQVSMGSQIRMLHVEDVMYFESDTKYTRVVAEDCDGLIRLSLRQLLDALDGRSFLQTHRSVLVNRRYIRSVHRFDEQMELELKGRPERLKVAQSNHPLFKAM